MLIALLIIQILWDGVTAESPSVTIAQGTLLGKTVDSAAGGSYYSFQGIPYAQAPLGELRFKAPQTPVSWTGTLNATSEGNVCIQVDYSQNGTVIGNEDCLFIHVYSPNLSGNLPVMFSIPGGAFRYQSGNTKIFGPDYLVEKDVVVVSFNYRLGPLGFLSLDTAEVPGNAALKDMAAALNWVRDNIKHFGGDSSKITVFGESAGAGAASLFLVSPLTKDLISGVIMQSGTSLAGVTERPLEKAKLLADKVGCSTSDLLTCLRNTKASTLVEATEKLNGNTGKIEEGSISITNIFSVVVESKFNGVASFINEDSAHSIKRGKVANVPVIVGTNGLEFAQAPAVDNLLPFVPTQFDLPEDSEEAKDIAEAISQFYFNGTNYNDTVNLPKYYELISDSFFNADSHRFVDYMLEATRQPIYQYVFDYVGNLNLGRIILGRTKALDQAGHTDELGYLFKSDYLADVTASEADVKTRNRMVTLWTNFAKYGNPTPSTTDLIDVIWKPVTKENDNYFSIKTDLAVERDTYKERMVFWDSLFSKYYTLDRPWGIKFEEAIRLVFPAGLAGSFRFPFQLKRLIGV